MISIQSSVKFRLLFISQGDGLRHFRDAIPDVFDQDNAFRHAQTQEIGLAQCSHDESKISFFFCNLNHFIDSYVALVAEARQRR